MSTDTPTAPERDEHRLGAEMLDEVSPAVRERYGLPARPSRLSADSERLAAVRTDSLGRTFIRVADDAGTKWWVHVLPTDVEGDSLWQRGIDAVAPGPNVEGPVTAVTLPAVPGTAHDTDHSPVRAQVEAIRDRWSGDPTGRYSTATERRDYEDVHYLLDRLAAVEAVLTPASTLAICEDEAAGKYFQQGADAVVRAVRSVLGTPAP